MNIKQRTVLSIVIPFTVMVGALSFIFQTHILHQFEVIEATRLERNVSRSLLALRNIQERQLRTTIDWAQYDETYAFVADKSKSFIDGMLTYETLASIEVENLVFFDRQGSVAHSVSIDEAKKATAATASGLIDALRLESKLFAYQRPEDTQAVILRLGSTLHFVTAAPIFDSKREKSARGLLIFTQPITPEIIATVGIQSQVNLDALDVAEAEAWDANTRAAFAQIGTRESPLTLPQTADTIWGFTLVRDIDGEPALLLKVSEPREIYQQGVNVRNLVLLCLLLTTGLAVGATLFFFHTAVLTRIEGLSSELGKIATARDFSSRISILGSDRWSLKQRTILAMVIPFLTMVLALSFIFQKVILTEFKAIEEARSGRNVTRAILAFQETQDQQLLATIDWAQFDDTYQFVADRNEAFVAGMLAYDTVASLPAVNLVLFDRRGEVIAGRHVDRNGEAIRDVPADVIAALKAHEGLFRYSRPEHTAAGIFAIGDGYHIVTAAPIFDSKREREPRGLLTLTQPLDATVVADIAARTKLSLGALDVQHQGQWNVAAQRAFTGLLSGAPAVEERLNETKLVGYGLLRDINSVPALLLELPQERDIYQQGLNVRSFVVGSLLLATIVALFISLYLFSSTVLRRQRRIAARLSEIATSGDFSRRVDAEGTDELTGLARDLNEMLDALEAANQQTQAALTAAEQANIAKTNFIAKVSHELRTPIHSIIGMLRILLKEEVSEAKRAYITMASGSAYGLLETINEILDFSKGEAGKLTLESVPFKLRHVVMEALRAVAPRVEEKTSIELMYDMASEVPDEFIGDPLRLKQCLINLLGNAVKFTEQGGVTLVITPITFGADSVTIAFEITDTGVGIPADRVPRIFDPFTQADDSVTRVFTGTGLGLTIVKQVMDLMGGTIGVKSTVGVGTTFTLTVPLACAAPAPRRITLPRLPANRIAVVDGESRNAAFMAGILRRYGYDGEVVNSADRVALSELGRVLDQFGLLVVTSEAVKRSATFDLVITAAFERAIPIVVILSASEIAIRERLTALSVPFVVTRPISVEDVLRTVDGKPVKVDKAWVENEEVALAHTRKLRILIADDALTNRIILTNMLEEAGHEVTALENGLDLLRKLEPSLRGEPDAPRFDVVLTDVQMPLMDGITATRRVRELERAAGGRIHTPIVAVTAHAMNEETAAMNASGVDDVITKPIEPRRLADVLRRVAAQAPEGITIATTTPQSAPLDEVTSLVDLVDRLWRQLELEGRADRVATPLSQATELLDIRDLYARSGDSVRRSVLILGAFRDCFKEQLAELISAKNSADGDALRRAGHTVKGLLLDIGSKGPASTASRIESAAKQGDIPEASRLVTEVSHDILVVARLVERTLETLQGEAAPSPNGPRG